METDPGSTPNRPRFGTKCTPNRPHSSSRPRNEQSSGLTRMSGGIRRPHGPMDCGDFTGCGDAWAAATHGLLTPCFVVSWEGGGGGDGCSRITHRRIALWTNTPKPPCHRSRVPPEESLVMFLFGIGRTIFAELCLTWRRPSRNRLNLGEPWPSQSLHLVCN